MKKINRRGFIKGSAGIGGLGMFAGSLTGCSSYPNLEFSEIPHALDQQHHVAPNHNAQVLLRWGDDLVSDKEFDPSSFTAKQQAECFGFNNDFIGFMPLEDEDLSASENYNSGNSERGLLCINHEYTLPHLMFPGFSDEEDGIANANREQTEVEMQACGHSVVEVELRGDEWRVNRRSDYTRRITLDTPCEITGPAAGHPRLQTMADPSGKKVLGTVGNCAGGKTPWGTVLIAEEGFGGFFMGNRDTLSEQEKDNFERLSIGGEDSRRWGKTASRFHLEWEPNEANRFGWLLEFDPYDPTSIPKKLTTLGRFEHEGTTIVAKPGERIAAYTGDDDEFQFIYKYVSHEEYKPEAEHLNRSLLQEGILYVAKFNEDGSGEWLPLLHGQGALTEHQGFASQADVLIECRRAAQLVGATPMDRPEDIETNPVNDCTYVMLTKNKKRKKGDVANMRPKNTAGHILEILHPGVDGKRDHSSQTFQWNTFALGGHPNSNKINDRGFYGTGPNGETVSENGWFACPDNLAFDPKGNMWVATDGCEAFQCHDGLWAMPTAGPYRAIPKHFFGCPQGAELCGPEFTPDGSTLFVAVQHPADVEGSSYDKPAHRWPDYDESLPPRPSVMAIRHKDGKMVGEG